MRKISFPLIALNFKTYAQAFGENAVRLAKIAEEVSEQFGITIAVAPPTIDLARVASEVKIPVFAQHVDPYKPGSHTGSILAEDVKAAGAVGSLINHSEHRLRLADIGMVLERLRENDLISLLCTDTVETTKAGAALSPDMLAIEPPELIGTGIPVSKAKPEVVRGAVQAVQKINPDVHVLCGAGISTGDDVARAIELGTEGVLLASAYVKAKDPKMVLIDMAREALKGWERRT
ncbi:MAG: triose-phosphate isomerase [Candidatus Wolframiiraptor sp. EX4484-121]|nr:MAG: triose-phosphate isomerase [Candidatus Wolframiiraptor sp. EX4484-121]